MDGDASGRSVSGEHPDTVCSAGSVRRVFHSWGLLIIQIFIAQGQRDHSLGQHGTLVMNGVTSIPWIGDRLVHGLQELDAPIDLPQQQGARIRGQPTSQEIGHDLPPSQRCEIDGRCDTLCHAGGPLVLI